MTLTTTVSRHSYLGAGTVGPFPYAFRIFAATDLHVVRISLSGVRTVLTYPTDYAVTGVGSAAGGTVILTSVLAGGQTLEIRRLRPLTQTTDVQNQGSFYPKAYEDTFDHLIMIAQQQAEDIADLVTAVNDLLELRDVRVPGASRSFDAWQNWSFHQLETQADPRRLTGPANILWTARLGPAVGLTASTGNEVTAAQSALVLYRGVPANRLFTTAAGQLASIKVFYGAAPRLRAPAADVEGLGDLRCWRFLIEMAITPTLPWVNGDIGFYLFGNRAAAGAVGSGFIGCLRPDVGAPGSRGPAILAVPNVGATKQVPALVNASSDGLGTNYPLPITGDFDIADLNWYDVRFFDATKTSKARLTVRVNGNAPVEKEISTGAAIDSFIAPPHVTGSSTFGAPGQDIFYRPGFVIKLGAGSRSPSSTIVIVRSSAPPRRMSCYEQHYEPSPAVRATADHA